MKSGKLQLPTFTKLYGLRARDVFTASHDISAVGFYLEGLQRTARAFASFERVESWKLATKIECFEVIRTIPYSIV